MSEHASISRAVDELHSLGYRIFTICEMDYVPWRCNAYNMGSDKIRVFGEGDSILEAINVVIAKIRPCSTEAKPKLAGGLFD